MSGCDIHQATKILVISRPSKARIHKTIDRVLIKEVCKDLRTGFVVAEYLPVAVRQEDTFDGDLASCPTSALSCDGKIGTSPTICMPFSFA